MQAPDPRIAQRRFKLREEEMIERHAYEYEEVHNGSGRSEELPSQLERRHAKEWAELQAERPQP
jgi:hypothetical protein